MHALSHLLDGATVCALSTPPGRGGIAVIRISGPDALAIAGRVFRPHLAERPSHTAVLGALHAADGSLLDECVAVPFRGPRSYTGEDTVELSVHGSPFVQEEAVRALLAAGCRLAGPGEFTLRAFLAGRIDLTQAEAVGDLIAAEHAGAHRLALEQLRGGFTRELGDLRRALIGFAGLLELELDFAEEDVEFADRARFDALLAELLARIDALAASFAAGRAIRDGIPVAIVGAPNRGKSTLLNALLGDERAIVSDIPGTTRDTVEDTCVLGGLKFRFIDTAGLRATDDAVEAEGIRRARARASEARIVLLVVSAAEDTAADAAAAAADLQPLLAADAVLVTVWNKSDAATPPPLTPQSIALSAANGTGLDALRDLLLAHSGTASASPLVVTNLRHYEALTAAADALRSTRMGLATGLPTDLCASSLRAALHHLGSITGEVDPEDILDHIFANFCIGK